MGKHSLVLVWGSVKGWIPREGQNRVGMAGGKRAAKQEIRKVSKRRKHDLKPKAGAQGWIRRDGFEKLLEGCGQTVRLKTELKMTLQF